MLGRWAKVAVLVVAVVVIAVEGYFVYQYYQAYYGTAPASPAEADSPARGAPVRDAGPAEETAPETGGPSGGAAPDEQEPEVGGTAFVHRAAFGNTNANSTYLDHRLTRGRPDAFILVAPVWEPEGDVNNARPVGVWYDSSRRDWAIYNQDRAPMPEGALFNVFISERPEGTLFVHRAGPGNTVDNVTYLDDPLTNGEPGAGLAVTPNWNPGGLGGTYHDHPVGVFYDPGEGRWAIFNQDRAPMPERAAFNVAVSGT